MCSELCSIFPNDICDNCVKSCYKKISSQDDNSFSQFKTLVECLINSSMKDQCFIIVNLFATILTKKHICCFKLLCDYGWYKICMANGSFDENLVCFGKTKTSFRQLLFSKIYFDKCMFEFVVSTEFTTNKDIYLPLYGAYLCNQNHDDMINSFVNCYNIFSHISISKNLLFFNIIKQIVIQVIHQWNLLIVIVLTIYELII